MGASSDLVPPGFRARVSSLASEGGPDGASWLRTLPGLLDQLLTEWELEPDAPTMTGMAAVAVPVRRGEERLVLKVGWPHREAEGEHLALRRWDGRGSVRLVAADPRRWAMLLERLDAEASLTTLGIDEACEVIGGLLRRLGVPALPQLRRLSTVAAAQAAKFAAGPHVLPRRFVEQAIGIATELGGDDDVDTTLLHTDLHFANVLAGEREPWLAIDPKPMAGHPAYEVAPVLWNRFEELGTGSSVGYLLRRRLEIVCDRADIDVGIARQWTIVREVENALWDKDDPERLTRAVAVIKGMNG